MKTLITIGLTLILCGCATRPPTLSYIWNATQTALDKHSDSEHVYLETHAPYFAKEISLNKEWRNLRRQIDDRAFQYFLQNDRSQIPTTNGITAFFMLVTDENAQQLAKLDASFARLLLQLGSLHARMKSSRHDELTRILLRSHADPGMARADAALASEFKRLERLLNDTKEANIRMEPISGSQ